MKKIIFPLLSAWGHRKGSSKLAALAPYRLILPLYHVVTDSPPLHLAGSYHIRTPEIFEEEMDSLLKLAKPVSLEEIMQAIGQGGFAEPSFHLSFDDGLREISEFVAPVLLRKGIPATFFLNTAFIDNRQLFYRFKMRILLNLEPAFSPALKEKLNLYAMEHGIYNGSLLKTITSFGYSGRHHLDALAEMAEMNFTQYLERQRPYLTEAEIDGLAGKGFTLGGHSIDHPRYAELSQEEQVQQAVESVRMVKDRFRQHIGAFAFPFTDKGVGHGFFKAVQSQYPNVIDLSFGTAGMKREQKPMHLQRIAVEHYTLPLSSVIAAEAFYYRLKEPFGKNMSCRKD